jgi:hypothetical protein
MLPTTLLEVVLSLFFMLCGLLPVPVVLAPASQLNGKLLQTSE